MIEDEVFLEAGFTSTELPLARFVFQYLFWDEKTQSWQKIGDEIQNGQKEKNNIQMPRKHFR